MQNFVRNPFLASTNATEYYLGIGGPKRVRNPGFYSYPRLQWGLQGSATQYCACCVQIKIFIQKLTKFKILLQGGGGINPHTFGSDDPIWGSKLTQMEVQKVEKFGRTIRTGNKSRKTVHNSDNTICTIVSNQSETVKSISAFDIINHILRFSWLHSADNQAGSDFFHQINRKIHQNSCLNL